MKQQAKTLETTLREKIATGYDPVTLNVAVRAVNEENIEVSIEGQKYSVRGNTVSEVHGRGQDHVPTEPVGEALPEDGNTNSPKSDPDDTGEIKGDEVAADVAGDEGSGKSDTGAGDVEDDSCLLGSSVQPAIFKLRNGTELQLGEIVRRAFVASGLETAREWNQLAADQPEETERLIQLEVNALDLALDTGEEETSAAA